MGVSRFDCVFWLATIMFSSPYFLWHFHYKHKISAIHTELRNRSALPDESPFPGVILCNKNKVKKSLHQSLSSEYDVDEAELKRYFIFDNCNMELNDFVWRETRKAASQWDNYNKFQKQASQSCSDMIVSCKWGSKEVDCRKWFRSVLSNRGLCCGFNIAHQVIDSGKGKAMEDSSVDKYNDWTPQNGFKMFDSWSSIPRRITHDYRKGLKLTLDIGYKEAFCTDDSLTGFQVMMHNPLEIPPFDENNTIPVYNGRTTFVRIKPFILDANKNVSEIDLDDRKCYFLDERKLRFYRVYTPSNCNLECLANYTIDFCGCLPKHIPVDFNVKICGKDEEECVSNMPKHYEDNCKCYRGCFEIIYGGKVDMNLFPNNTRLYEQQNWAVLDMFYGDIFNPRNTLILNDEFVQYSYYANISGSIALGLIVIKLIHFFSSLLLHI